MMLAGAGGGLGMIGRGGPSIMPGDGNMGSPIFLCAVHAMALRQWRGLGTAMRCLCEHCLRRCCALRALRWLVRCIHVPRCMHPCKAPTHGLQRRKHQRRASHSAHRGWSATERREKAAGWTRRAARSRKVERLLC